MFFLQPLPAKLEKKILKGYNESPNSKERQRIIIDDTKMAMIAVPLQHQFGCKTHSFSGVTPLAPAPKQQASIQEIH